MTDPNPDREPPLVSRVEAEPPLVERVEPPPPTRSEPPRPGLVDGIILTLGFAFVLFGTMIGVVLGAALWFNFIGRDVMLEGDPEAAAGSVASIPPILVEILAWSFPIAYAAALGYTALVFRKVAGRGWTREVGLRRVPAVHLILAVIALPGFILGSDLLARVLFQAFGQEELLTQSSDLGDLFQSFHWTFAVLALGVGPGVVEELWCRGFLGRGFVSRYGWVVGVALASLFFGLLHAYPPAYVLTTAAMGVGLHFAYAMSRSLWVPILMHTLNNSFAGLAAVGAIPSDGMEQALAERLPILAGLTIAVLMFSGFAMWANRVRIVAVVESDTGAVPRGVMVPPPESGVILSESRIKWSIAVVAAVSSVLLWLSLFA